MAFITSSGTMDKKNPSVRKYIAQRADLLGAIRLPNNAFLANAGTGVVADILFLQKRDRPMEVDPDWVHLGSTKNGYTINQYFVDNPDMVLGELTEESTQYGKQAVTVKPIAGAELSEQLSDALANIHAEIAELEQMEEAEESVTESIPADPSVRNFSFTVVNGEIYYRENSVMHKVELSVTAQNRIKGMVKIRDCTRRLIEYQLEGYPDHLIEQEQRTLNHLYDEFTAKYGLLNSRGNNMTFSDDSSYCLLCSLEVLDENGSLVRKADMFSKRTIRQQEAVASCDTAMDALAVSLSEKAMIDMAYMSELTGKSEEQLYAAVVNKKQPDGIVDVVVNANDAAKVNRIAERFALSTVDVEKIRADIQKNHEKRAKQPDAEKERSTPPAEKAAHTVEVTEKKPNPTAARMEESNPSAPSSDSKERSDAGSSEPERTSVRQQIKEIRQERQADKAAQQPQPHRTKQKMKAKAR